MNNKLKPKNKNLNSKKCSYILAGTASFDNGLLRQNPYIVDCKHA